MEEKHHQGCEKPIQCPKCKSKNIVVTLTNDKFWKVKCKCNFEAMYI